MKSQLLCRLKSWHAIAKLACVAQEILWNKVQPYVCLPRGHFESSLKQMMIQARMQKASYIMASLSQRTTSLLKLPSQANVLSTRHLFLYSSAHLLRRPLRFPRGGMQGITPLRRSQLRKRSQSYALSATSLSGLFLGRPLLRGTRTRSKVLS